jgi:hypothetical protein
MLENINFYSSGNKTVEYATAKFLEINIKELENILIDLEKYKNIPPLCGIFVDR